MLFNKDLLAANITGKKGGTQQSEAVQEQSTN